MRHLVRVVLSNGASYMTAMAWRRPNPGLEVTTTFLTEDYLNHERFTGVKSKKKKIGRRAAFENKFNKGGAE